MRKSEHFETEYQE